MARQGTTGCPGERRVRRTRRTAPKAARVAAGAALWVWCSAAQAGAGAPSEVARSPRQALSALPLPPAKAEEARSRWSQGADRAVEPIRQGARLQLALAQRELAGQRAFGRDPMQRRAAAARLEPEEVRALLAVEEARAAEPVQLSRQIDTLVRSAREEIERERLAVEEARRAALAACPGGDRECERAAEREARKARARLLSALLEQTTRRWELLRLRLDAFVAERQRLAERVATATSDPYVKLQAQGLLADAWKTVAELADEVEKETELAARLAE